MDPYLFQYLLEQEMKFREWLGPSPIGISQIYIKK